MDNGSDYCVVWVFCCELRLKEYAWRCNRGRDMGVPESHCAHRPCKDWSGKAARLLRSSVEDTVDLAGIAQKGVHALRYGSEFCDCQVGQGGLENGERLSAELLQDIAK